MAGREVGGSALSITRTSTLMCTAAPLHPSPAPVLLGRAAPTVLFLLPAFAAHHQHAVSDSLPHPPHTTVQCAAPTLLRTPSLHSQLITSVRYRIPSRIRLTPECTDLLARIFVADPAQRITLQQIKQHPWFRRNLPQVGGRLVVTVLLSVCAWLLVGQ